MNDTVRGLIVFVTVLITIGIWAPLRNRPERLPNGTVLTETYFGVFRYLTLRTETREPEYNMEWFPNYNRLALTGAATVAMWTGVWLATRKRRSSSDQARPD